MSSNRTKGHHFRRHPGGYEPTTGSDTKPPIEDYVADLYDITVEMNETLRQMEVTEQNICDTLTKLLDVLKKTNDLLIASM